MSAIDEAIAEFLVESHKNLDQLDADLLALQRDSTDLEAVASAYHVLYTVKWTCGLLGFRTIESVAHAAVGVVGRLRKGDLVLTDEIATALGAASDAVRRMMAMIEQTGTEGATDYRDLVDPLTRMQRSPVAHARVGELLVASGAATPEQVTFAAYEQDLGDGRPIGEILIQTEGIDAGAVGEALTTQYRRALTSRSLHPVSSGESLRRADAALIDDIADLISELAAARNEIARLVAEDADLVGASERLDAVTDKLQQRMVRARIEQISHP